MFCCRGNNVIDSSKGLRQECLRALVSCTGPAQKREGDEADKRQIYVDAEKLSLQSGRLAVPEKRSSYEHPLVLPQFVHR